MDMPMPQGVPWLDKPMTLHGMREYTCKFNDSSLCDYQQGYWRFWYEADHRYALPTVAFFLSTTLVFSLGLLFQELAPKRLTQSPWMRRKLALYRFLSSRSWRIGFLNWNSAPLGVLLLGAVGIIYFFSMTLGPKPYYWPQIGPVGFGDSPPIATRSGWMSLACMPFVFLTSGKSNIITLVTRVSHEKLQVFHRWISYAMYILALIHTFPFIIYAIQEGAMVLSWNMTLFYWTGVVALIAQTYLTFASMSPLRNLAYEWFKYTHFLAGLVFVLFLFFHCDFVLTSWDYFIATGVLFSLSWLHRHLKIYLELGLHKATLSIIGNGFIRVSVPTHTTWRAGQHFFVRFLGMGVHALSVHPFTACSLPNRSVSGEVTESELVFYIRPQGGFTNRLARHIEQHPESQMRVLLDGPYGGIDMEKLADSERYLVIAGGSGAGWVIPIVTAFLRKTQLRLNEKVESTMRVILATRDVATRTWFEQAVNDELASFPVDVSKNFTVEIYYTGSDDHSSGVPQEARATTILDDPEKGATVQLGPASSDASSETASTKSCNPQYIEHRPNLPSIVAGESTAGSGSSLGVFVCGPLEMQNDVANAVAKKQLSILRDGSMELYLHMEHFAWA